MVINGDISAFGCKVLSDEYSNPSLIILTFFALPIVFDFATIAASTPLVEVIDEKSGNCLYPLPPEIISILSIGPCTLVELVVVLHIYS